jgi:hypothetical protein
LGEVKKQSGTTSTQLSYSQPTTMKKFIICTLLLSLASTTFSQQTNPSAPLTRQDYLLKSKRQKTAASILLGGGLGIALAGAMVASAKTAEDIGNMFSEPQHQNNYTVETVLVIVGGVAALSSIPLFSASSKNKRMGMSLQTTLKIENVNTIYRYNLVHTCYPALSLKINL